MHPAAIIFAAIGYYKLPTKYFEIHPIIMWYLCVIIKIEISYLIFFIIALSFIIIHEHILPFVRNSRNFPSNFKSNLFNLLKQIPQVKFEKDKHNFTNCCPICLNDFNNNDLLVELPCDFRHYFHVKCIHAWFQIQENACCPLCKRDVLNSLNEKAIQEINNQNYENLS